MEKYFSENFAKTKISITRIHVSKTPKSDKVNNIIHIAGIKTSLYWTTHYWTKSQRQQVANETAQVITNYFCILSKTILKIMNLTISAIKYNILMNNYDILTDSIEK